MSLLSLRNVHVHFNTPNGVVRAVSGVSLDLAVGETLGLVGESGCGKSTLGKAIMKLVPIAGGEILIEDVDIAPLDRKQLVDMRRKVQMIFQDPYGSLNPRSTVGRSVAQPLALAGWKPDAMADRVETLLRWVGLPSDAKQRYPHEFSGGQRQRIGIARALALSPKLIICDEPVSALDVSVRAQVINLLEDLKGEFGVSYLFISHDLSVVEHIADRVAVMYLGMLVETGAATRSGAIRSIPTPRRCWRRRPSPIPRSPAPASARSCRASCQARSTRPRAAPSIRAARSPRTVGRIDKPALRAVGGGALAACHFV